MKTGNIVRKGIKVLVGASIAISIATGINATSLNETLKNVKETAKETSKTIKKLKNKYGIRNIDILIGSKHTSKPDKISINERYKFNEENPGVSITFNNGLNVGVLKNSYANLSAHIGYEMELYKTNGLTLSGKAVLSSGYYDENRKEMGRINKITKKMPLNLLPGVMLGAEYKHFKLGVIVSKNPTFVFGFSF